jgi:hypothetical protein
MTEPSWKRIYARETLAFDSDARRARTRAWFTLWATKYAPRWQKTDDGLVLRKAVVRTPPPIPDTIREMAEKWEAHK